MVVNKWISSVDKKATADKVANFLEENVVRMVLASGLRREDFDALYLRFPERRNMRDEDNARKELQDVVKSISYCSGNARLLINCIIQGRKRHETLCVLNCEKSAYYVWKSDALNQFANAYLKFDLHVYKNGIFTDKMRTSKSFEY